MTLPLKNYSEQYLFDAGFVGSSDLDLSNDIGTEQVVGLRFGPVNIPGSAMIVNCSLQFNSTAVMTGSLILRIRGDSQDGPMMLGTTMMDLENRNVTNSFVDWSPPDWKTVNEASDAQLTPNLRGILQEKISSPGWVQSNDVVFLIRRSPFDKSSHTRTATTSVTLLVSYEENRG